MNVRVPSVARRDETDRVSSAGYALGYLGGGVLLVLNLAWILQPAWFGLPPGVTATKLSFASVGVWWMLFSIPLLRRVPEPPREAASRSTAIRLCAIVYCEPSICCFEPPSRSLSASADSSGCSK